MIRNDPRLHAHRKMGRQTETPCAPKRVSSFGSRRRGFRVAAGRRLGQSGPPRRFRAIERSHARSPPSRPPNNHSQMAAIAATRPLVVLADDSTLRRMTRRGLSFASRGRNVFWCIDVRRNPTLSHVSGVLSRERGPCHDQCANPCSRGRDGGLGDREGVRFRTQPGDHCQLPQHAWSGAEPVTLKFIVVNAWGPYARGVGRWIRWRSCR